MTSEEYRDYQESVKSFFAGGLNNLSIICDAEGYAEPYFSHYPCVCCKRHLSGDRYDCNGYNERTGEVEEYHGVCTDCVYYAEYGRLDDETMWEIEHEKR